jgi:hypothetical protein
MYPHRIRLAGPWECDAVADRVTIPCQLRDVSRTVRFTRRFGYPGRIDDYERVWLTIAAVAGRARATLNGEPLDVCEAPCEFEVTRRLRDRNLLQLDMEPVEGEAGLTGEVALEVRRTAFLRDLRVTAKDGLHVCGEVAGTAEGTLELYVVCARRNVAYATVKAGERFALDAQMVGLEDSTHPTQEYVVRVDLVQGAAIWYRAERTITSV